MTSNCVSVIYLCNAKIIIFNFKKWWNRAIKISDANYYSTLLHSYPFGPGASSPKHSLSKASSSQRPLSVASPPNVLCILPLPTTNSMTDRSMASASIQLLSSPLIAASPEEMRESSAVVRSCQADHLGATLLEAGVTNFMMLFLLFLNGRCGFLRCCDGWWMIFKCYDAYDVYFFMIH